MKFSFFPQTKAGKWSSRLFLVFIVAVLAVASLSVSRNRNESTNEVMGIALGIAVVLMSLASILASIAGFIAILKDRERSILVYLTIPFGLVYLAGALTYLIAYIALRRW